MRRRYSLFQVDAFTDRPLAGNPCAVVLGADDLNLSTMQAIAAEMNLAETAFVIRSEIADFGARYFTPAVEIPLAGHPTLATVRALLDAGRIERPTVAETLTIELVEGPITVEVEPGDDGGRADEGVVGGRVAVEGGAGELITMTQRRPVWGSRHDPAMVADLFGLRESDMMPGPAPRTVSTGTPFLVAGVRDLAVLRRAETDIAAFRRYRESGDFMAVALFCLGGFTAAGDTAARIFDVPPDLPEDPFTGSATGCMAAWLWRHELLDSPVFVAEQGHGMGRPGRARVEVVGPPHAVETVRVGGRAVTVMEGELRL